MHEQWPLETLEIKLAYTRNLKRVIGTFGIWHLFPPRRGPVNC
jgi:hypothetical protein